MNNIEDINLDLEIIFSILNGKVSLAVNRKLNRNLKKAGLGFTPEQWTVLTCLWNKDGRTQQELCNMTFKDKPAMTRLINNLEKQELVIRQPDLSDKRTNLIFLTEKGKESEELTNQTVLSTMKAALEGVSREHFEIARTVLKTVFENLKTSLTHD